MNSVCKVIEDSKLFVAVSVKCPYCKYKNKLILDKPINYTTETLNCARCRIFIFAETPEV